MVDRGTRRTSRRFSGVGIKLLAGLTLVFGLLAWLTLHGVEGPRTPLGRATVLVAALSTPVVAGLLIARIRLPVRERMPRGRAAAAFIVYADLGIAAVLLSLDSRTAALHGAMLLMLPTMTGAYLLAPRFTYAQLVLTTSITLLIGALALVEGDHDTAGVLARVGLNLLVQTTVGINVSVVQWSQRRLLRERSRLASVDPLTGLLNRRGLVDRVIAAVQADPLGAARSVLLIDVDRFKAVNDTYGHDHGDVVLRDVADRLAPAGLDGVLGRLGGEEFVLVADTGVDARALAASVCDATRFEAGECAISVSVGVAPLVPDALAPEAVVAAFERTLRAADAAMYTVKDAGGDGVAVDCGAGSADGVARVRSGGAGPPATAPARRGRSRAAARRSGR